MIIRTPRTIHTKPLFCNGFTRKKERIAWSESYTEHEILVKRGHMARKRDWEKEEEEVFQSVEFWGQFPTREILLSDDGRRCERDRRRRLWAKKNKELFHLLEEEGGSVIAARRTNFAFWLFFSPAFRKCREVRLRTRIGTEDDVLWRSSYDRWMDFAQHVGKVRSE